jgi:hypothetical protein
MSLKVLVVPEDFTKDEHILKPLIEKILDDRTEGNVRLLRSKFQVDAALNLESLRTSVVNRYPMVDTSLPVD